MKPPPWRFFNIKGKKGKAMDSFELPMSNHDGLARIRELNREQARAVVMERERKLAEQAPEVAAVVVPTEAEVVETSTPTAVE
jgi:hypothetical protein